MSRALALSTPPSIWRDEPAAAWGRCQSRQVLERMHRQRASGSRPRAWSRNRGARACRARRSAAGRAVVLDAERARRRILRRILPEPRRSIVMTRALDRSLAGERASWRAGRRGRRPAPRRSRERARAPRRGRGAQWGRMVVREWSCGRRFSGKSRCIGVAHLYRRRPRLRDGIRERSPGTVIRHRTRQRWPSTQPIRHSS